MQKYIEIDWLQDVDTIQKNALFPYISNTNNVSRYTLIIYKNETY